MAKLTDLTFHESYGEVSVGQLRAYKAHNVSPSDHDDLVDTLGADSHGAITAAVIDPKNNLEGGKCFSTFLFHRNRERNH